LILSAEAISDAVRAGDIVIDPFNPVQLSPNSYDFRLGNRCKTYVDEIIDPRRRNAFEERLIPEDGILLSPGRIYLVNTLERMGSFKYVPIIRGRSSTGRLGLFTNVTADLIDLGSINQWTLQLAPVLPLIVFPGMIIGQVTFWIVHGERVPYTGKYKNRVSPVESLAYQDVIEDNYVVQNATQ
jgi:dCTP deaminase